jgi:hypothetical protein
MRRVVLATAAVLLCSPAVTACSDPPTDQVATAGASPSGAARPTGPASDAPTVTALSESDLADLEDYTYAQAPGVPETVNGLDADFVTGYIGRAVLRDGERAGVVQLVRLRRTAAADEFAEAFVQQYAQTGDVDRERLLGQRVLTTSLLRGRPGGLVAWVDGRVLVLVSAEGGVAAARRVARAYLQST